MPRSAGDRWGGGSRLCARFTGHVLAILFLGCGRIGFGLGSMDGGEGSERDSGGRDFAVADMDGGQPSCLTGSGPLVLYVFAGLPDANSVSDSAPALPDVPVTAAPRSPLGMTPGMNALSFDDGLLVADSAASAPLRTALQNAGALTVEAWLVSDCNDSEPARIVTLSSSPFAHSFMLGCDTHHGIFRLRTEATNDDGSLFVVGGARAWLESSRGSFTESGVHHLVGTYDQVTGLQELWFDNNRSVSTHMSGGSPAAARWDIADDRVGIGDAITGDAQPRHFIGDIYRIAIYDRALSATEIACLHAAGVPGGP